MVPPKRRGVRFEYRVAHEFERFGYEWDRARSSLGVDLKISLSGKPKFLVSCKKTSSLRPIYLPTVEIERLARRSAEVGAIGLICFGFRRTRVLVLTLDQLRELPKTRLSYKLSPRDGRPLAEFLGSVNT